MPIIDISPTTFDRLQRLARPFVDTIPEHVINRVFDEWEAANPSIVSPSLGDTQEFDPSKPPSMSHTKLIDATFGQSKPEAMNWNGLVRFALERAVEEFHDVDYIRREGQVNIVQGRKEIDGYKYVDIYDFSYQGISTSDAVRIIFRLARMLKFPARVEFEWRQKDEAEYPGQRGRMVFVPRQPPTPQEIRSARPG